ncbi:MAG: 4a-hydroxytetrahydrobiopterin dehydratase [Elusimicrobia bacterium]|nr:4a-hydroxytetrahydrobiopterin dehydratase [Elusimicrobiota bacterium]
MAACGWKLNEKSKSISKLYIMRDFSAAIAFMKTIHPVAQAEDHHPDLHLTNYRRLRIVLSTQGGWASDKDFILAAKIEALPKALKAR